MRFFLLAAALALVSLSWASAQEPQLRKAVPVSGPAFAARLSDIDAEWNISLQAEGKEHILAAADLALYGEYRDAETGPQILLADGSVLVADVLDIGAENLTLGDASGLGRVLWNESVIPLKQVVAILYQPSASPLARDKLIDRLRSDDRKEDRLLLTSGEVIAGRFVSVPKYGRFAEGIKPPPAEVVKLIRRGVEEPLAVPLAKVAALSFSSSLSPSLKSRSLHWLGMRDGSLVAARRIVTRRDAVEVELQGGGTLKAFRETGDDAAPTFWDHVTLFQPAAKRVVWLSDLTPAYKQIPFLTAEFPLGIDRNDEGGRLRHGERTYLKGLGMHSASRTAFDVPEGAKRFEAELALDDLAGLRGSVVGKVLLEESPGNWRAAFESPIARGGDSPIAVSVELKGASRLALLVEFADRGDECDHANWLSARLIK